jgi:hypothetical protein
MGLLPSVLATRMIHPVLKAMERKDEGIRLGGRIRLD